MTHDESWGGIPPDPDHERLMTCSVPGCHASASVEPLVVVGLAGAMRVLCRKHLADPDVGAERGVLGSLEIPPPKKEGP